MSVVAEIRLFFVHFFLIHKSLYRLIVVAALEILLPKSVSVLGGKRNLLINESQIVLIFHIRSFLLLCIVNRRINKYNRIRQALRAKNLSVFYIVLRSKKISSINATTKYWLRNNKYNQIRKGA